MTAAQDGGREASGSERDTVAALRRLLLNGASLLGAYVLPRLCTFFAAVLTARLVGVEAFGAYGTAASLSVLLAVVATLGMMQLLVRELAQSPERVEELLGAANVVKIASALSMLALLALALTGPVAYPREVVVCGLLLGLGYAVGSWVENLGAYFQAVERMQVWMQAQTLAGLVTGASAAVGVLATGSILWLAGAHALGQAAALAWLLARAPAGVRRAWRAPWPVVARLSRALLPFTVSVLALTAYAKVDVLLLERLRGLAEAGLYAAAYKFVDVAQALSLVVATALYPRISRSALLAADAAPGARQGSRPLDPAAGRTAELVLLGSVPAAALLWLLREPVVMLLFGPSYAGSAAVLSFLAPVLPLLAFNVLGTFVLAASRRMTVAAALYSGGLVVDLALNALLVPAMGAAGAALARLLAEVALAVAMVLALRRVTRGTLSPRVALAVCLAAALAALLGRPALPPPGAAAAYLSAAALVYLAVGVVSAREVALLRRAVRR